MIKYLNNIIWSQKSTKMRAKQAKKKGEYGEQKILVIFPQLRIKLDPLKKFLVTLLFSKRPKFIKNQYSSTLPLFFPF